MNTKQCFKKSKSTCERITMQSYEHYYICAHNKVTFIARKIHREDQKQPETDKVKMYNKMNS